MFKRLTLAVACVCGCAALALEPAAAEPTGDLLRGRTKQKRVIRLAQHGNRIQIKSFSIELRCRDGSALVDAESGFMPTPLRAGGRIRDHQIGSTDDVWIRGRLQGRALHGAIRVRDRVGRVRCDSKWVRFRAK